MKKIINVLIILIIVMCIPFNSVQAMSNGGNENVSNTNNEEVEKFYDYITNMKSEHEILNGMNIRDYVNEFIKNGKDSMSLRNVANKLAAYGFKEVAAALKLMGTLVIISIVCVLITNLERAFSNENLSKVAYFACYSLLIIIMAKSFYVGVDLARETIKQMCDFMLALIPVLLMLLASIGGFTEVATIDPIVIAAINISARVFCNVLIPIICMGFVLQFVNNISDEYKIDKLTKFINQGVLWAQGIIMTIFIGILSVRGTSSKTLDHVVAKTAKYAVDNFVPIVGKCLSDAISTVAGYSLLLKNALSSVGLIILIVIVIFPIIKVGIIALLFKVTGILIEPVGDKKLVDCISSAGDSLVLIMSCLICVSVMFFIMISIIASAGKMAVGG